MRTIKIFTWLLMLFPIQLMAQQSPVLTLDSILQRIDRNNIQLQTFDLRAEAYKYSANAATAWMPPMVGFGTFMTPYPGQTLMEARDKGQLMLRIEQDIPNTGKLNARKRYIESQGNIERSGRGITLNELKAQAKQLYFTWLIAQERISVLQQNEKIMETMKKIEEVRYPYNQSQLGSVYKAEARIEENRNMIRMQEGEIARTRAWLNALMNQQGNEVFEIDTTYEPSFSPATSYDTASLATSRRDVLRMNESIRSMELNIESMRLERRPDFKIVFDHMPPLDKMMPTAYSIMGMMSIPIVPWSRKMYKSEIRAMEFNIQSMQKERSAMLQEAQGMLYGMQYEIQSLQNRIKATEQRVIPALQKTLDVNFINYQENKLQLPAVIDSWEALTMMQASVLDDKLRLYQMIVDYEKELYRSCIGGPFSLYSM